MASFAASTPRAAPTASNPIDERRSLPPELSAPAPSRDGGVLPQRRPPPGRGPRGGGPRPPQGICTGADRASDGSCAAPDLAPNAPQQRVRPGSAFDRETAGPIDVLRDEHEQPRASREMRPPRTRRTPTSTE